MEKWQDGTRPLVVVVSMLWIMLELVRFWLSIWQVTHLTLFRRIVP